MLYDGDCALCSAAVQHVLAADREALFRFAPLQGSLASQILPRHGRSPADLDTFCVLLGEGTPQEKLLVRSRAALHVARRLGGWRAALAALGSILPTTLLDWGYDLVARNRHRLVKKREQACWMPKPEYAGRFLD